MTLFEESLLDNHGTESEYWRVEKEDSAVILTMQGNDLVFPKPNVYRPGVGKNTLDFPSGRVPQGKRPIDVVPMILERELGIHASKDIISIQPLNQNNALVWLLCDDRSKCHARGIVHTTLWKRSRRR